MLLCREAKALAKGMFFHRHRYGLHYIYTEYQRAAYTNAHDVGRFTSVTADRNEGVLYKLNVCVYIYIYIHIHTYIHMYTVSLSLSLSLSLYIYIYIYTHHRPRMRVAPAPGGTLLQSETRYYWAPMPPRGHTECP